MKKSKQLVSLAITAAMIVSSFPVSAFADKKDDSVFVTMNIPYNTFYSADIKNDVDVDAVTSATASKWRTFGGTYRTDSPEGEGGQILGVSFPVAVTKDDISKLNAVESENADFYYTSLEETPSVYKTLTIDNSGNYSFSEIKGEVTTVDNAEYTLSTNSVWGDYLFEFADQKIAADDNVYAIVLTTDDGTQYGLRHLENIWKKKYEFSWGSGIKTTEPHGNTFAAEHYKSIMGKTIKNVSYITDKGITNYTVDAYVPVKVSNAVTVADAKISDTSTAVTVTPELPEDFKPLYSTENLESSYADGKLSYNNAKPGSYTLTVSDENGKYADIISTFVLSTDKAAAKYDSENTALAADNSTEDEFKAYLGNISAVSVDGTDYAATGKHSVKIIGDDGKIDLTAKSGDNAIFAEDKNDFKVTVVSTGYPELTFTVSAKKTSEQPKKKGIVGDVNGDDKIDSSDSLSILRASVKLETFADEQFKLADIDTDGKVTSADSLAVLRASVKLFDEDNKSVGTEIELAEK